VQEYDTNLNLTTPDSGTAYAGPTVSCLWAEVEGASTPKLTKVLRRAFATETTIPSTTNESRKTYMAKWYFKILEVRYV